VTHPLAQPTTAGRVTGVFHVGLTVREMDEALRFYRDTLGLELESRYELPGRVVARVVGIESEQVILAWLAVPGSDVRLELFEYQGIERSSLASRPCDIGYGHLCLYVEDLDAIYQRLCDGGYDSRTPPVTLTGGSHAGAKVLYATSPDGYDVELYERASAP
jgi:lactoylglutathione lyase